MPRDELDYRELDEGREDDYVPREVACRNCGSTNVFWALASIDGPRELFNTNGRKHVCKKADLQHRLDAFDELP